MDWDFLKSLVLVAVGAGITYGVDAFRRAAERRKVAEERVESQAEARRIEGRGHAQALYDQLNKLSKEVGGDTYDPDGDPITPSHELNAEIYNTFPLVPDPDIRSLVSSGMYGVSNPDLLTDLRVDSYKEPSNGHRQRQIIQSLRLTVAAYLRGDRPDPDDVELLARVEPHVDSKSGF